MEGFWATFSALVLSSLGDTKKGGLGRPSKIGRFFGRCWGLPGGPQEGSRLHGSSIFTFTVGAKKVSKMTAKIELFGLPNPHDTHFGAPFGRNGCPKRGVKKGCNFEQKSSAFWGGGRRQGVGPWSLRNPQSLQKMHAMTWKIAHCVEKFASRSAPPTGGGGY